MQFNKYIHTYIYTYIHKEIVGSTAAIIEDVGVRRGIKLKSVLMLRIATMQDGDGHTLCTRKWPYIRIGNRSTFELYICCSDVILFTEKTAYYA